MKVYLYLSACGIAWILTEYLLIIKFNVDILLLAIYGGSCVGTIAFSLQIWEKK